MFILLIGALSLFLAALALEKLWRVAKSIIYWTVAGSLCVAMSMLIAVLSRSINRGEPTSLFASASPWLGFAVAAGTFLFLTAGHRRNSVLAPARTQLPPEPIVVPPQRQPSKISRRRLTLKEGLSYWSRSAREARARALEDERRNAAWDKLQNAVDWAPSEVALARRSCESFLVMSESSVEFDVVSLRVALRKRITEIIDEGCHYCDGASPSERRALLEQTVENLQRLGAEADRLKRTLSKQAVSRLAVTSAYVESVTRSEQARTIQLDPHRDA